MNKKKKEQYQKLLYRFEEGTPLMDIVVEMGEIGVDIMKLDNSPLYLMACYGPGNAVDPYTGGRFRVFSIAYQTKFRPIHYILIGTPEKGWKVSSEDSHDCSKFKLFLDLLLQEGKRELYQKSFEKTGIREDMIQWSGRKVLTLPGVDF